PITLKFRNVLPRRPGLVRISMPSRVHMTLIDLGESGYRRGGGIGFAVEQPRSELSFVDSTDINLNALLLAGYSLPEVKALESVLSRIKNHRSAGGLTLSTVSIPPRHTGFGTGTAVALACVGAYFIANNLSYMPAELVSLSRRG